jgi:hypothetical protein
VERKIPEKLIKKIFTAERAENAEVKKFGLKNRMKRPVQYFFEIIRNSRHFSFCFLKTLSALSAFSAVNISVGFYEP